DAELLVGAQDAAMGAVVERLVPQPAHVEHQADAVADGTGALAAAIPAQGEQDGVERTQPQRQHPGTSPSCANGGHVRTAPPPRRKKSSPWGRERRRWR